MSLRARAERTKAKILALIEVTVYWKSLGPLHSEFLSCKLYIFKSKFYFMFIEHFLETFMALLKPEEAEK